MGEDFKQTLLSLGSAETERLRAGKNTLFLNTRSGNQMDLRMIPASNKHFAVNHFDSDELNLLFDPIFETLSLLHCGDF